MGVRYVILREFDASKLSHAESRAFWRIHNLNRDARIPGHKRDRNTPTRDCHITRRVKYKNLRRGLPGRPNDTQELGTKWPGASAVVSCACVEIEYFEDFVRFRFECGMTPFTGWMFDARSLSYGVFMANYRRDHSKAQLHLGPSHCFVAARFFSCFS